MFYKATLPPNVDLIHTGTRDMYFLSTLFNMHNILLCNLFDLKIAFSTDIKGYSIFIRKVSLGFSVKRKTASNVLRGLDGRSKI